MKPRLPGDQDRQESGYLLNQLARRYEGLETEAAGSSPLPDIAALDGAAIQQAAQRYLDTQNDVKVSLLPAGQ